MSPCSRRPACRRLLCRSAGTSGVRAEQPAAQLATCSPSSKRRPPARRPEWARDHTRSALTCGFHPPVIGLMGSLSCGSKVCELRRRTAARAATLGQLFGAASRGRRAA